MKFFRGQSVPNGLVENLRVINVHFLGQGILNNSIKSLRVINYGGGLQAVNIITADGDRHSHNDLPVILAGRGNGQLKPGRLIENKEGTPMTNLYLSLLEKMGVEAERVGDSTGRLSGI